MFFGANSDVQQKNSLNGFFIKIVIFASLITVKKINYIILKIMEPKHVYVGLTDEQVSESRRLHGVNLLTPPKKKSVWILFLEKFKDPIIRIRLSFRYMNSPVWVTGQEYFLSRPAFLSP